MRGGDMGKISFRDIIELLFLPVLTAGVFVLWDLNKNVNDLNVRVGVIITQNGNNEKRIDALEKRIEKIEEKQYQRGQR